MRGVSPEIKEALQKFAAGPTVLRAAIDGMDPGVLNRRPPGEDWSPRDVIMHLADAELVRAVRLRQVLSEDAPVLTAWDEGVWKRRLHYLWRDPDAAVAMFEQVRFSSAELLEQCDAASWQRSATLGDQAVTAFDLVKRGVEHIDDHTAQITAMRAH